MVNSKREELYIYVFNEVLDLLTIKRKINIDLQTVVTDQEKALIISIKKYFPNIKRIACLYHYKQDILPNLKSYGLFKKSQKKS